MSAIPVQGRPLCFQVQSRTEPNTFYFVDWTGEPPYCTCPDFHKQGAIKSAALGEAYLCFHLREAKESGWLNYVETVKEIQLAQ